MDTPVIDPATEDQFARPYTEPGSPSVSLEDEPIVDQPVVEDAPEIIDLGDGGQVSIEKAGSKWKAVLNPGEGNPEVFYGKTKNELFSSLAVAKLNATRKIRQLNREKKLGINRESAPAPVPSAPQIRELTAEDALQIKTQLQSDPSLAMETWFQKKTGMTMDQLVKLASEGRAAKMELTAEAVAKQFIAQNPEYNPVNENFEAIVAWLCRHKLHKNFTARDEENIMSELYNGGFWTVEHLNEAYEDLAQDGLLVQKENMEDEEITPATVRTPAPDPRIVSTVRRPRAGLGIRTTEVSSPTAARSLSADDLARLSPQEKSELLDQLSDKEVADLYEKTVTLKKKMKSGRR